MVEPQQASDMVVRHQRNRAWYWLLIIPFIGTLWTSSFASVKPLLWGIPFFYWYQFLWIIISSALTWIVYAMTKSNE